MILMEEPDAKMGQFFVYKIKKDDNPLIGGWRG
jgi:hypothetical protein